MQAKKLPPSDFDDDMKTVIGPPHFPWDLRMTRQSWVWITRPWPFLIEPTMGSPGIGRQHLANCTAMPSEPRITTAPASLASVVRCSPPWVASLLATTAAWQAHVERAQGLAQQALAELGRFVVLHGL